MYLAERGSNGGEQQTKTKTALEFFAGELTTRREPLGPGREAEVDDVFRQAGVRGATLPKLHGDVETKAVRAPFVRPATHEGRLLAGWFGHQRPPTG